MIETTDLTKFQNRPWTKVRTLALLEAKQGKRKQLLEILLGLVEPTQKEKGNIAYVPHYSIDNPDKILYDELWMSKEDLDIHFEQPHMKDLLGKIEGLLAKPLTLETFHEVRDIP